MKNIVKTVMCLIIMIGITQTTMSQDFWPAGGSDSASAVNVWNYPSGSTTFLHFCYTPGQGVYLKAGAQDDAPPYDWGFPSGAKLTYIVCYNPVTEGNNFQYYMGCGRNNTPTFFSIVLHSSPIFTTQPQSLTRLIGESASFNITAGMETPEAIALPYTYQWQRDGIDINGQTTENLNLINLTLADNGQYRCIVSNQCGSDTSDIATLIVNCGSTITSNVYTTICQGDSIFVGGQFQTTNGTYLDTLQTANGCDSIISTNLTVNLPPATISLGADTSVCNNFQLNVAPCNECTYNWSNGNNTTGITVSTSGQYWVHVSNTCGTVVDTINITITGISPFVDVAFQDTIICSGNSVLLTATGNGDFVWSTGDSVNTITVIPPQNVNYTVYAYNACGIDSTVISISVTQPANAGTDSTNDVCSNYVPVVNLTGYLSPDYQSGGIWIDDDATGALYGTNFVTGLVATNNYYHFTYVVSGNAPCPNDSAMITLYVQVCSGIVENNLDKVVIYPNPLNDNLTIETSINSIIEIINSHGQIVKYLELKTLKNTIDLKELNGGVYTIRIITDSEIIVKKLIKQ